MRYALNNRLERIEVTSKRQRATCSVYGKTVISKMGKFNQKHWSHQNKSNCDSWYEPITEWHLKWQKPY